MTLRLLLAALLLPASLPAAEPAVDAETDEIAANLRRADDGRSVEDVGLLKKIGAARKRWQEAIGLDYSVNYHVLGLAAIGGDDVPTAFGGDLTLQGIWAPGKHWDRDAFELRFRLRSRDAIGDAAPSQLGGEIGTLWGVVDGFTDRGFEIPDFYLRHVFKRSGVEVRYGQMTIDSQFDTHVLSGSKQSFLNQAFSGHPGVAFPRFGAGLTLARDFDSGFDLVLGATNIQGTSTGDQVDFKLNSGDMFGAVQLGYEFCRNTGHDSRLQLMLWHSDGVEDAGTPAGQGFSLTFERELDDTRLRAFARLAWADSAAAAVDWLASGGIAWKCHDQGLLGIASGLGHGSGPGDPVQFVVEGFYRWQPREGIRITPDLQLVGGEGFADSPGLRVVAGLRLGIDF